jgi:hypothetical protein
MTGTTWRPRTLEKLDALIQAARSEQEKRILLVKKACALTRFSLIEEANAILQRVRATSGAYEPRLCAWIMFCEGLMGHFGSLTERASRDFKRAYAVSIAAGDIELGAIASAWIASSEFTAGNLAAVPSALVQTFTHADRSNAAARARACLVIADLYNCAGDSISARAWYKRGRDAAVDEGDIAMQSVGMYNDAAYRVWNVVMRDCDKGADEHAVMLASVSVDSVGNLDLGLGLRSLTSMVPLLRAEVCTVQRKWDEAIGLFDAYLCDRSVEVHNRLVPKFQAQRAYCLAMAGDHEIAVKAMQDAVAEATACTEDFDDLFVLHTRAATVFECASMHDDCQAHRASAERCLNAFTAFQAELKTSIEPMVARIRRLEEEKARPRPGSSLSSAKLA